MKNNSFFATNHSPYYIHGLDYRESSAGIRVLHYLCHALNEMGEEAYIYCNVTNPSLRTPKITNEIIENHHSSERKPIAVYPEVIYGNPFNSSIVVRYILNTPGHLAGDHHYEDREILFHYADVFLPKGLKSELLWIPSIDTAIFHNNDNEDDNCRTDTYYYANKYRLKGYRINDEAKHSIDLSSHAFHNIAPHDLAALLRKAALLYCYEPSAIAGEAILCGCPVILVKTEYFSDFPSSYGAAFSTDPAAIAKAKQEIPIYRDQYLQRIERAWTQLESFIEITQAAAKQSELAVVAEPKPNNNGTEYWKWLERHRFSTQATKRFIENLPKHRAVVHVFMYVTAQDNQLLELTIESVAEQVLAGCCQLTVFTEENCPDLLAEKAPQLTWVNTAAEQFIDSVANTVAHTDAEWLLIGIPGLRLAPAFTTLINAAVSSHPEWRLIYCDEDTIGRNGRPRDPLLKPNANLDLLRSTCYIGNACLIHRELWAALPSAEIRPGLLLNYAAALRCYEVFGESALGHIDQIILHQPHTLVNDLDQFEKVGLKLLRDHLLRQRIFAKVSLGLVKGSFFVEYPLTQKPLVSIIILIKDQLDLIKHCIDIIVEKTAYLHYEVILIDNHSSDQETLKYLNGLPANHQNIRVVHYSQHPHYSTVHNLAAQTAKGDYLLFLNDDTVIVQPNWLERLVALGLREDVGVVGCRLVHSNQTVQHAGMIIGLGSNVAAGHIGYGLPIDDVGYMGRAQLAQNFSAVSADCMLVRKNIFEEVGGFDEKSFPTLYHDVDLCLRIIEAGYRIVWTPFVTVVCNQKSGLEAHHDLKHDKSKAKAHQLFIKKWNNYLANDPAYNRHLSFKQQEWVIDGHFDVTWHPDLEPLPRIIAQPPDEMGVGRYRMLSPVKGLTENGYIASFILPPLNSEKRFLPSLAELMRVKPDVLFFQNAFTKLQTDDLQSYAELAPHIFRVFGQDDIIFSIPKKSSAYKYFGKDTKLLLRRAISLCHRVIVTNEIIAEAMRDMSDDIKIVPNYLERSLWGNLQKPNKQRSKPRVGWAGAQQHQGDLEFILPVVEATANKVDWIFMGMCPPKLRYHVAEVHNAVDFNHYPAQLAALDLDLAIAPLEINRFNSAKSNLRLLEYGAVGYPVICTDIEPYRNAPVTRVPNNSQIWIDTIYAHIYDMDATQALGQQLQDWVLSNWMLDQHFDEWMKALLPD